jgi:hypothetical protein
LSASFSGIFLQDISLAAFLRDIIILKRSEDEMLDLAFVILLDFLAKVEGRDPRNEGLRCEPVVSYQPGGTGGAERNISRGATAAAEKRDPQNNC